MLTEIVTRAVRQAIRRAPDFVVGDPASPYLRRWWVIPRNRVCNIYLHEFLADDDDRALHDHPWASVSLILYGGYVEHTIAAGGIHRQRRFSSGDLIFRRPRHAHRLALVGGAPCWTIFVTGPKVREWGFHFPDRWVHWSELP